MVCKTDLGIHAAGKVNAKLQPVAKEAGNQRQSDKDAEDSIAKLAVADEVKIDIWLDKMKRHWCLRR